MSRGVKITLIVVAVVLVVCCLGAIVASLIVGRFAGQAFTTDPNRARQVGHEIADYTLPAGYSEQAGMNMAGIRMVVIAQHAQTQSADEMAIIMMQFPASLNLSPEEMERQIGQQMERQFQRGNEQMQVVGTQPATIKGQTVTLTVSEGTGSSGVTHRQVTGVFPGKDGTAMLMAFGAKDTWNQQALDNFLASIR